ncbi:MAG: PKD domain-containing protein, partial [Candidatus Bathyarchaeota archaeon]|nr:PKD domain-containing protein [Candidatus Bathyarchaeota archaeon]
MKAKFITVLVLGGLFVTASKSYAWPLRPVAILTADPEYVMKDVNVTLDGSGSYDPDGGPIVEYCWDYNDSLGYEECGSNSSTTTMYANSGTYTVKLRVKDNEDQTDTDTCMVYVNVKISVPGDVNTIQEAIVDANDGISTIVVSVGTYYENVDFKGKGITLTSTDPNNPEVVAATIITDDPCDPNVHVVTFKTSEDANSVLIGFTITDGNANGSGDEACGGGIYCNNASPIIRNCKITGNKASGKGGGIYCDNASATINNCLIKDNETSGGDGGGMYNYNCSSSLTITNCIFSSNSCFIVGNWRCGGGMCNDNSSPKVINCIFSENRAYRDGGGMSNFSGTPTLINCTFSGNYANNYGGGMSNGSLVYMTSSSPIVTNCIFWGNIASRGQGGNMRYYDEICNWEDSNPTFSFCDIKGWPGDVGDQESWNWDPGYDGGNNISSSPDFVDALNPEGPDGVFGTVDDGLRITAYSPCVDEADDTVADFPATDITGRGRVDVPNTEND